MTLDQIKEMIIGQYGALLLLGIIVYTGYKRIWVWGWYSKELQAENLRLQKRLDATVGLLRQSNQLNEKTLDMVEPAVVNKAESTL